MKLFSTLSSFTGRATAAARHLGTVAAAVRRVGVEFTIRDLQLYVDACAAQDEIRAADYFEEAETVAQTLHRYARWVADLKRQISAVTRERDSARSVAGDAERQLIEARDLTVSRVRSLAVRLGLASSEDEDDDARHDDTGVSKPAAFEYSDVNRRIGELLALEQRCLAQQDTKQQTNTSLDVPFKEPAAENPSEVKPRLNKKDRKRPAL